MIDVTSLVACVLAVPMCVCIELVLQWAVRATGAEKQPQ